MIQFSNLPQSVAKSLRGRFSIKGECNMTACNGVTDWLSCLRCEHICSTKCPIESDNVVAELAVHLRAAEQLRMTDQSIVQ